MNTTTTVENEFLFKFLTTNKTVFGCCMSGHLKGLSVWV